MEYLDLVITDLEKRTNEALSEITNGKTELEPSKLGEENVVSKKIYAENFVVFGSIGKHPTRGVS